MIFILPTALATRMNSRRLILATAMILAASGCAGYYHSKNTGDTAFVPSNPTTDGPKILPLEVYVLGARDRNEKVCGVLSDIAEQIEQQPVQRRGLAAADCGMLALHANDCHTALWMLQDSIDIFDNVTVGGESELQATSYRESESAKVFKGEPHERVLVHLYRGLLFLAERDYENAHACFLNASLQDALAEEESARADWLAVDSLLLLCKRLRGDPAASEFAEACSHRYAAEIRGNEQLLELPPHPVLFVMSVGQGPRKTAALDGGNDSSSLGYAPGSCKVESVAVASSENVSRLVQCDDVYNQAVTRGQRTMDSVLTMKEQGRRSTQRAGTAAAVIGHVGSIFVPGLDSIGNLLLAEALEKSSEFDASADVRQLYSTPAKLFLAVCDGDELKDKVSVQAFDAEGCLVGERTLRIPGDMAYPIVVLGRIPY